MQVGGCGCVYRWVLLSHQPMHLLAGKSAAGGPRGRRGRLLGRGKGRKAAAQGPLRFLGISPKIGNIALNLVGMFRPPGLGNLQG